MSMELRILPDPLSVLKLSREPESLPREGLIFFSRTGDETSLVCGTPQVPNQGVLAREDGWRAFRIVGSLDFSLCGVLAGILNVLAGERIPVFAVSTYDTDYILLKEERLAAAAAVLTRAGYRFV